MAEEINQLLTIEIDQRAVNNAIAKATEARKAMDALRQANKELAKAEGDNTEQIVKNNIEIKKNSAIVRENERIVLANEQAQESSTGSVEQLRRQLSVVTIQWTKLSEGQRKNTEEGKRLTKQKLDLTNKLKAEEKATGDTRRNVGNYTDSIREAIAGSGAFGQSLVGAIQKLQATTRASLKFTKKLQATTESSSKATEGLQATAQASSKQQHKHHRRLLKGCKQQHKHHRRLLKD